MVKLAKEITPPLDGMRDPPISCQHALPHQHEDPQVGCMEAEWRPLQDKVISESAIRMILAATIYTTGTVYKAGGTVLLAGVAEGSKIPFTRL